MIHRERPDYGLHELAVDHYEEMELCVPERDNRHLRQMITFGGEEGARMVCTYVEDHDDKTIEEGVLGF